MTETLMTETLMSGPLTDLGEALMVAARGAVLAEVVRVHHDHECTGLPAGWVALGVPQPCERCGRRVFALRRVHGVGDRSTSRRQVFHVGWLVQRDGWVRMVAHTAGLCRQVRGGGPPLQGRRAAARVNRGWTR